VAILPLFEQNYLKSSYCRETQHVELKVMAFSLHNIDKQPLKACPHLN